MPSMAEMINSFKVMHGERVQPSAASQAVMQKMLSNKKKLNTIVMKIILQINAKRGGDDQQLQGDAGPRNMTGLTEKMINNFKVQVH